MATYKITNNSLLFFSAKFFLDSVNTLFQFRFVETKYNKWVLEFRLIDELILQRKPISICLTSNQIALNQDKAAYYITTCENNIEEDVQILKVYYILHELLVEALNKPDLILPQHCVSVSDLKIFAPYHFDNSKFPSWEQQSGNTTLRISNAGVRDNYANIYFSFNIWKYDPFTNKRREAAIKKRKLQSEIVPETISNEIVCEECQPIEIKLEA